MFSICALSLCVIVPSKNTLSVTNFESKEVLNQSTGIIGGVLEHDARGTSLTHTMLLALG